MDDASRWAVSRGLALLLALALLGGASAVVGEAGGAAGPLPPALVTQQGHSGWVISAVFSPDGAQVLTASWDGTARLWEAATGKELCSLVSFRDDAGESVSHR